MRRFLAIASSLVGLVAPLAALAGTPPVEVAVYRSGDCGSWREAVATVKAAARELGMKMAPFACVDRSCAFSGTTGKTA